MTIHKFEDIIIAIDGHSSCGKSTFAKALAKNLGYLYIDSGAMYRAVTILCINNGLLKGDNIDLKKLSEELQYIDIQFVYNDKTQKHETFLNGKNVETEIRSIEIAKYVSIISKIPKVRERLVSIQRKLGENKRIVMDGRDIGTVVFPNAEIKIFMTADVNIRAERRFKELILSKNDITIEAIKENLTTRDNIDANREASPLKMADDAVLLDNSYLTPEEQLNWGLDLIKNRFNKTI